MQRNLPGCSVLVWRACVTRPMQDFLWKGDSTLPITQRMRCAWRHSARRKSSWGRWHGYRAANRYIVFQVLPHTLGLGAEVWRVLAKCHEVRNLGEYEGDLNIDDLLLTDLLAASKVVAAALEKLKPL